MKTSMGYTIPADLLHRFHFTVVCGLTHVNEWVNGGWVYWGYLVK